MCLHTSNAYQISLWRLGKTAPGSKASVLCIHRKACKEHGIIIRHPLFVSANTLWKIFKSQVETLVMSLGFFLKKLTSSVHVQWSHAFLSFKSHFGSYEEEIKKLTRVVQDEASLASQQAQRMENELQMRERAEQSRSRQVVTRLQDSFHRRDKETYTWRLEIDRRKLEREKLEALDSISCYDYQSAYRRLRRVHVPGTSHWICRDSQFREWETGSGQRLWLTEMWVHPIGLRSATDDDISVGAGKSMIRYVTGELLHRPHL